MLDERGRVVARVGETVYMGGEGGRAFEGRRELQERYPGIYWTVGTGVCIPQQQ